MNKNIVIKAENISKKYLIGNNLNNFSFREAVSNIFTNLKKNKSNQDFWALKNLNFEINQGEVIGIIGLNGAGKSTLLKILSRITYPTEGKISIKGRVGSLLEVGTGFSGELTGRENIYLNGSILGMTRKEIAKKFDQIVDFSGVKKFIDTPVKRYSSGMYVRLAFSVAAHLEPEILLVDEVLAVGDFSFQNKCLGKMKNIAKSGRTVLFVSHNIGVVKNLCQKTMLLNKGNLISFGDSNTIIEQYLEKNTDIDSIHIFKDDPKKIIQIDKIQLKNFKNESTANIYVNQKFKIIIDYQVRKKIDNILLSVIFYTASQELLLISDDFDLSKKLKNSFKPGKYRRIVEVPANIFNEGLYYFNVVTHMPLVKFYDQVKGLKFRIISDGGLKVKVYKKESTGILSLKLKHKNFKINSI